MVFQELIIWRAYIQTKPIWRKFNPYARARRQIYEPSQTVACQSLRGKPLLSSRIIINPVLADDD
jgi:hypothetical protein